MGCDIHAIIQVRKDGNWEYVPGLPAELKERNYGTFALLAGVRNSFSVSSFPAKGLPDDIGAKKYDFKSEYDSIKRRYENDKQLACKGSDGKFYNAFSSKLSVEISEERYNELDKMLVKGLSPDGRFAGAGWSCDGNVKKYYVHDASAVGGVFKEYPLCEMYPSFESFCKELYEDEWDEDAQDYGYWRINFDCEDYHTPSYLSLKELKERDYSDYFTVRYKVPSGFVKALKEKGVEIPFSVKESSCGDIADCIREAVDPTVTVFVPISEEKRANSPITKIIAYLDGVATEQAVADEDIRIVFAFDNLF